MSTYVPAKDDRGLTGHCARCRQHLTAHVEGACPGRAVAAPAPRHRVRLHFDDGLFAELICPPGDVCDRAGCYQCWIKTWFENLTAEELLFGSVEVEVDVAWDSDHPVVTVREGAR